jgi:tol-pal system protein YbgF
MQSTTKFKAILCLFMISNNISFAAEPAVVEDRSIFVDSDINAVPKAGSSSAFNRTNNQSNDFSSQATLNESNAGYIIPNEQQFKALEDNASQPTAVREQPIYNARVNQPSRQQVLKELESMPVNARLNRLENIIETQKNLNINEQIKVLQDEIQSLRGMLESERHKFEQTMAQQKSLYDDLERKFSKSNSMNTEVVNNRADDKTSTGNTNKQYNYTDEKLTQQDLYTTAYTKIKSREYNKAIELFNKYIETYPKGVFAANSHYWLGEIYMIQSEYNKSLDAFDKVLKNYPTNSKSADALYKKGLIHIYLKQFDKAKTILAEVKTKYKNTTAARLADQQLQTIENINKEA